MKNKLANLTIKRFMTWHEEILEEKKLLKRLAERIVAMAIKKSISRQRLPRGSVFVNRVRGLPRWPIG